MFVNNFDPILFSLGPIDIRYYGLAYVIGFLLVWYVLSKHHKDIKLSKDEVGDLAFWIMMGVIIGSRLYSAFVWNPSYYLANPLKILAVWEGGMAFHGGLIGAVGAGYWYTKKKNISLAKVADLLIIPALFALALGRLANFTNHELYGPVTDVAWCVQFNNVEGCRHPYQIYSFLKRMAIVGLLLVLKNKKHKDGFLFWIAMFFVGLGRFFLDYVREDILYWGLSTGQWSSLAVAGLAFGVLLKYYKNDILWFNKNKKN